MRADVHKGNLYLGIHLDALERQYYPFIAHITRSVCLQVDRKMGIIVQEDHPEQKGQKRGRRKKGQGAQRHPPALQNERNVIEDSLTAMLTFLPL